MSSQKTQPTPAQIFVAKLFGTWALTLFGSASVITLISILGGGSAALFGIGAAFGFIVMDNDIYLRTYLRNPYKPLSNYSSYSNT